MQAQSSKVKGKFCLQRHSYEGFHSHRGTPNWMVCSGKSMKILVNIDDLGVPPVSGKPPYKIERWCWSPAKKKDTAPRKRAKRDDHELYAHMTSSTPWFLGMTQNYCLKRWLQILQKLQLWLGIPSIPTLPKGLPRPRWYGDAHLLLLSFPFMSPSCQFHIVHTTWPRMRWDWTGFHDRKIYRNYQKTNMFLSFLESSTLVYPVGIDVINILPTWNMEKSPFFVWQVSGCLPSRNQTWLGKSPQNEHA